ncbi:MAG TPA: J domain-containing protein [Candidatus Dormibacteraeota bacterium]
MPQTKNRSYYDVLGVDRKASQKEVSAAFRKLARKHHPDANAGDKAAEERFKEISEAHEVLSDPEKRKFYDAFGKDWQSARAAGIDPSQAGRAGPAGFGGFGGDGQRVEYRDISPEDFAELFGGAGGGQPFGDIFGSIFSGGRGRAPRTAPVEAEGTVRVTLQEAYRGTQRTVQMPDGRRLEVSVPAGVGEGTVLRVPGLRARVEIEPDPVFKREGRDVRVEVSVPLRTALLGGEVEVPTLKGTRVKLTVKPETQNGTRLRLRGLGMPGAKGGAAGDLYAEVKVRLPVPMDAATRAWAEQMPPGG